MTDRISRETRSRLMSMIRSKDTVPELTLRKALWARGLRYRKYYKAVPGCPDIAFPTLKVAVFVDGCFWHGCPLHASHPSSNVTFWANKLAGNQERDRKNEKMLEKIGWTYIRFWEHEVEEDATACAKGVQAILVAKAKSKKKKDLT